MTERIIPYMGQTGRDRDIRQAVTSPESQVTNNGHTFRDSHAFQNFTILKSSSAYFSHGLSVNDLWNDNLQIVSLIACDRDPFTVFYPRKQPGLLHEDYPRVALVPYGKSGFCLLYVIQNPFLSTKMIHQPSQGEWKVLFLKKLW